MFGTTEAKIEHGRHLVEMDKGLGFVPGALDERDWKLSTFISRAAAPQTKGSRFWYGRGALDQGNEGACTGFSWTQRANSSPVPLNYDDAFAHALYHRAQELDEWPGTDYEGTSIRAGGLAAREKGLIEGFAYAADVEELAVWILNNGPCIVGIDWWTGMDRPSKENGYFVVPEGSIRGGHAIEVDGARWLGKGDDYFRLRNSWGPGWGRNGRCKITADNLEKLLSAPYAAACTAVEP